MWIYWAVNGMLLVQVDVGKYVHKCSGKQKKNTETKMSKIYKEKMAMLTKSRNTKAWKIYVKMSATLYVLCENNRKHCFCRLFQCVYCFFCLLFPIVISSFSFFNFLYRCCSSRPYFGMYAWANLFRLHRHFADNICVLFSMANVFFIIIWSFISRIIACRSISENFCDAGNDASNSFHWNDWTSPNMHHRFTDYHALLFASG